MNISADFSGGNIVIDEINDTSIILHQDLRDTLGDWFYWCFRVTGAAGRTVRFQFSQSTALGARGPALSTDAGATWGWLGTDTVEGNAFTYHFPSRENDVFFGMTIPYTEAHWRDFLSRHANHDRFETGTLFLSRKGRRVESLRLGNLDGVPRNRVLLTARHHACETMASYVLEGVISHMLSDAPETARLNNCTEFLIIPFVDKDGVEDGDQGKNRAPRDHNRDYDGRSVHAETAALREQIPSWTGSCPVTALDLHCPWLCGGLNERIYFVGLKSETMWREQQKFSKILQKNRKGPLPFDLADNLPFGKDWNVDANYTRGKSFARWASEWPQIHLVSTIEIPYANAGGAEVNPRSARQFGGDLARALAEYLPE